jgi:hypothetical protein
MLFPPEPTATHKDPLQATSYPIVIGDEVTPNQVVPLYEYAIEFVPLPTATQIDPFQTTLYPAVPKMLVPKPFHKIPFTEVNMVFVPLPTATHRDPLYATPSPCIENTVPREIQLIPSKEVASVAVFCPTATHIPLFEPSLPYAIPLVRVVKPDKPVDVDQLTPSNEYASVFVPAPPATQIEPLYATQFPYDEKTEVPIPVQVKPSYE